MGDVVEHYFDNLLPDSDTIRKRIQQKFASNDMSPFTLLVEVGRDCLGAIQLLPEGEQPTGWDSIQVSVRLHVIVCQEGEQPTGWDSIQVTPLSEKEVEQQLHAAVSQPMGAGIHDDCRISIAGAQSSMVLASGPNTHHPYFQVAAWLGRQYACRYEQLR